MDKILKLKKVIANNTFARIVGRNCLELHLNGFLVGGFIRDFFLDYPSADLDFVIQGNVHELAHKVTKELGLKPITLVKGPVTNIRLVKPGLTIDLTQLIGDSIQSDLARRDFTINTLALSLNKGEFLDIFEGLGDIRLKLIRSVSSEAFRDDPLRAIRAFRFACTLKGFSITEKTWNEIKQYASMITRVSPERVKGELDRIITSPHAVNGYKKIAEVSLFQFIFREFFSDEKSKGRAPAFEVFSKQKEQLDQFRQKTEDHFIKAGTKVKQYHKIFLNMTPTEEKFLSYASIFASLRYNLSEAMKDQSTAKYPEVDELLAQATIFMKRMRFSNLEIKKISTILSGKELLWRHFNTRSINKSSLRELINRIGWDIKFSILLFLAECSMSKETELLVKAEGLIDQIIDLLVDEGENIINPPIIITGEEVSEATGIPQGVKLGRILHQIRSQQIKGLLSSRQEALNYVTMIKRED